MVSLGTQWPSYSSRFLSECPVGQTQLLHWCWEGPEAVRERERLGGSRWACSPPKALLSAVFACDDTPSVTQTQTAVLARSMLHGSRGCNCPQDFRLHSKCSGDKIQLARGWLNGRIPCGHGDSVCYSRNQVTNGIQVAC